jgi:hypothetical protein
VKLTVNGKAYSQPLTVRMDPRVKTPAAVLARQFAISKSLYDDINHTRSALDEAAALRTSLRDVRGRASGEIAAALDSVDRAAAAMEGGGGGFGGGGGRQGGGGGVTLGGVIGQLAQLYEDLQNADVQPTTQLVTAVGVARQDVAPAIARWDTFRTRVVAGLNARLRAAGLPEAGVRR